MIGTFVGYLASLGPIGAIVGAIVVSLALVVIVLLQVTGIYNDRRTDRQRTDFQDRLLRSVEILQKDNERLTEEAARQRDEIARQGAMVDLLREQQRRLIDMLQRVMDGRLAPADITPADLPGAP